MFGKSETPVKENDTQKHQRLVRERNETLELLNRLADELRPKIDELQPELLARAEAAHKEDADSYSFECSRSGDFLSVTITRGYKDSVLGRTPVTMSTTLNLRATTEFVFTEGHLPDRAGSVEIPCNQRRTDHSDDGVTYISSSGYDEYSPRVARDGYEWRCELPSFYIERTRQHYRAASKDDGGYYHGYYCNPKMPKYEGHVRVAEDDRIEFRGIGITIFAPAGLGRSVHDKILTALR